MVLIYEYFPSDSKEIVRAQQQYQDSLRHVAQLKQESSERLIPDEGSSLKTLFSESRTNTVDAEKFLGGFHEFWKNTNYDTNTSLNIRETHKQVQKLVGAMSHEASLISCVSNNSSELDDKFDDDDVSTEMDSSYTEGFEMRREQPHTYNEDLSSLFSIGHSALSTPRLMHKHLDDLVSSSNDTDFTRTPLTTNRSVRTGQSSNKPGDTFTNRPSTTAKKRPQSRYLDYNKQASDKPQGAKNSAQKSTPTKGQKLKGVKPNYTEVAIPIVSIAL